MIESALSLARILWEKLAGQTLSRGFIHKIDTQHYASIEIIPYKHLEDSVTWWHGVLRSFVGSKAKLFCTVSGSKNSIKLICSVPKHLLPTLEASLYANMKYIDIHHITTPPLLWNKYVTAPDASEEWLHDQDFKKDASYLDPFVDLLSLYDQVVDNHLRLTMCFDFDAKPSMMKKIGGMMLSVLFGYKSVADSVGQKSHLLVKASISYAIEHQSKSLQEAVQGSFSKFCKTKLHWWNVPRYIPLEFSQVSNLFHVPAAWWVAGIEYLPYRKIPPSHDLPTLDVVSNKNDLTIIGKTEYRGNNQTFWIKREDKLRHMYIIWKTWVGKSNLIANLARSDMISNKGICVIDPHGDLVDDIIAQVPSYRINDVVLFDVADREWPVGFNVLEFEKPEEKPLIASGIISIFKKLYGHSRGPRLEYILRNVLLSILEYPNATLMHVLRMLTDDNFRADVLEYVKDPVILNFWKDEFDAWPQKQREEAISPITNKVGQFTSSQLIRNIFWQQKSKINFRKLMDEGKIILINLSKGKIWEDSTNLLGSFVVSKIQIDIMSRADLDESERKDFYLYIDEFQNFATESFATILSEARKYKLGLILANQYGSQLDDVTRSAIFGNVGTMVAMTLGYDDAVIMANQFKSMVSANDFLDIPKYKAYIKLMINWVVSDPFNMQTIALPPGDNVELLKEKIRSQSRQRYAINRVELEELIKTRAERSFSKVEKAVLRAKEKNANKGIKEVVKSEKSVKPQSIEKQWELLVAAIKSTAIAKVDAKEGVENNAKELRLLSSILPKNFDAELYEKYSVEGQKPDAILRDALKKDHKIIYYDLPHKLVDFASLDPIKQKGQWYKKGKIKIYKVFVDMYQHHTLKSADRDGIDIRVGSREEIITQIQHWFTNTEKRFFVERERAVGKDEIVEQSEKDTELLVAENTSDLDSEKLLNWSENEPSGISEYAWIKVWKTYEWYVKLKYNYGLFVTVGELDGLLHKKLIDCPWDSSRKKLYEIGDPIVVKALEIKELDGKINVVRSQL